MLYRPAGRPFLNSVPSPYWAPTRNPALMILGNTRMPLALLPRFLAAGVERYRDLRAASASPSSPCARAACGTVSAPTSIEEASPASIRKSRLLIHRPPPVMGSLLAAGPFGFELALARVVDDLAQDARQFLRGVKAHRVLRGHEIEPPLRLAVLDGGGLQIAFGRAGLLGGHDRIEHVRGGPRRPLQECVVAILDREHARLELLFCHGVAGLAGAVQVQERTAHPVVTHLERADTLVGHVAVR